MKIQKEGVYMLKHIPPILSPDLLYVLASMGHGDEIIIADGNFPCDSSTDRLIRCDGHGVPEVLEAVLQLMPLDDFVDQPAALMKVVPGKFTETPPIWAEYRRILDASGEPYHEFEFMERFAFYERAKHAYAIVATSETSLFANILLKKGTVRP